MDVLRLTGIRPERVDSRRSVACASNSTEEFHTETSQPYLSVDILAHCDLQAAGQSADITQTVDYEQLAHRVASVMKREEHGMLETLGCDIADAVLLSHLIHDVEVSVHTHRHITGVHVDEIAVTIRRESPHHVSITGDGHKQASLASASASVQSSQVSGEHNIHLPVTRHAIIALQSKPMQASHTHRQVLQSPEHMDAQSILRSAIVAMDSVPGNQVAGISPLYRCANTDGSYSFTTVVVVETTLDHADIMSSLSLLETSHAHARVADIAHDVPRMPPAVQARLLDLRERNNEHDSGDIADTVAPDIAKHAEILAPWIDLDESLQRPDSSDMATLLVNLLRDAPNISDINKVSDTWILGGAV